MPPKVCIHLPCVFEVNQRLMSYYRAGMRVCTDVLGHNDRHFHTKYFINLLDFVVYAVCVY
jgi:hypothetical protein